MTADLEERAREVLGRALGAVDLAAPAPAPDRARRRDLWPWLVATAAVAAAVVAYALIVPGRSGGNQVTADQPDDCAARAATVVPAGTVVGGTLPDGDRWEVEVTGRPPNVGVWFVRPGEPGGGGGSSEHDAASWPNIAMGRFAYSVAPVAGGLLVSTELPPDAVRMTVEWSDGTRITACARTVEGIDGVRYAGVFVPRRSPEPPVLRAYAADGTRLTQAGPLPSDLWDGVGYGYGGGWDAVGAGVTATTAAHRPPVPAADEPCGSDPPPFRVEDLPERVDPEPLEYDQWRLANTTPGHAAAPEPYDPVFTYASPVILTLRIDVYHGNSWRLNTSLVDELEVLGHDAWLSELPDGTSVVDFQVEGTGDPCDYWAIRGPDQYMRAAAASIVLDD